MHIFKRTSKKDRPIKFHRHVRRNERGWFIELPQFIGVFGTIVVTGIGFLIYALFEYWLSCLWRGFEKVFASDENHHITLT